MTALYPERPHMRRPLVADPTEHAPTVVFHQKKWQGTGLAVGCTHANCGWQYHRTLLEGEDIREIYALFHPPVDLEGAVLPHIPVATDVGTAGDAPDLAETVDQIIADAERLLRGDR